METMIVIGAALALAAVIVHWAGIYLPPRIRSKNQPTQQHSRTLKA